MTAPFAKEVGSVGIRALPLTNKFRDQLKRKLDQIEKSIHFRVNVDRVRVDRNQIDKMIRRRLDGLRTYTVNIEGNFKGIQGQIGEADRRFDLIPAIDQKMLNRISRQVEESLERIEPKLKFDLDSERMRAQVNVLEQELKKLERHLSISVLNEEEKLRIRHRINQISEELDDMAKDRTVRVDVNPFTAWAAARLKWLARPRIVEIIPQVSKVALAKAVTALAALSGARLSFDYLRRFSDWMSEVDKKLPRLAFGVTGITTAFSALMGSISGIVGIGDGLAALLPSLLLLPGLFAGAALSGVALFVALKHSKDELDELGPSYTNLGKIIRTAFWEDARPAIIDFSNSIMPQLERSFDRTSRALGRFTANLAGSFKREFANGRLEAMFEGLAQSWDVLATGTDAFAGALTNLGLVASRYMPRLAAWFVRQADNFDNWLSLVSTDGRLSDWIEESIDAYYALWDVAAATTGIFQGLWKAAEAGGSKGLRGFADMLLSWEKAVNGAKWQETLTSMFRGAGKALSGFGDGLERVGEMLHFLRSDIEHLMSTSGDALGRFIGKIADALARPEVSRGMRDFIDGVSEGLRGLELAFEPVSELFGELMGFVGELGRVIGDVLGTVGKELAPGLQRIIEKVRPKLDSLGEAFKDVFKEVDWESLGEQAGELIEGLLDVAEKLAPILREIIVLIDKIGLLEGFADLAEDVAAVFKGLGDIINLLKGDELSADSFDNGFGLSKGLTDLMKNAGPAGVVAGFLYDELYKLEGVPEALDEAWAAFPVVFETMSIGMGILAEEVQEKIDAIILGFQIFKSEVDRIFEDPTGWLSEKGALIMEGLRLGMEEKFPGVTAFVQSIQPQVDSFVSNPGAWLLEKGIAVIGGFIQGLEQRFPGIGSKVSTIKATVTSFLGDPLGWLYESGRSVLQGFIDGIEDKVEAAETAIKIALAALRDLFPFSPAKEGPFSGRGWVSYSGQSVGETFGSSIADSVRAQRSRVAAELSHIQHEFGRLSVAAVSGSDSGEVGRGRILSGTTLQANVNVNTLERDPHRIGREVVQGLMESLYA